MVNTCSSTSAGCAKSPTPSTGRDVVHHRAPGVGAVDAAVPARAGPCVRVRARDNLDPSFKMLARISRLQEELLGAWSVLSTLTPFEYSSFRNTLGRSSGFQSLQYRVLGVPARQQES